MYFFSVACDSACSEGLMRCYDFDSEDCCLFYNDGMCVSSCTSPLIPDSNFNCICPGFFIYPACTGTCVLFDSKTLSHVGKYMNILA